MDVGAFASAVSANSLARVQEQASLLVLKKANDMHKEGVLQLLQTLPQATPTPGATLGGTINTYA